MAEKIPNNVREFTINSADDYVLGGAHSENVATWHIHLVKVSGTVSLTVKSRSANREASAATPLAVPYCARYLNGVVSNDALVTTTITDTSMILVPASGQSIVLSSGNTGVVTVYARPLEGAAA